MNESKTLMTMAATYRNLWLPCLLLAAIAGLPGRSAAQVPLSFYDFARPDLNWYTIETDHFNVIFHAEEEASGSSRTAQVVSRIAEEIYAPITALYAHEPNTRVSIILKDYEDYSNGAAYFFDNKIEIWAPSLDTPLRGEHNWLRNVITHEFTHIVQVQKAMKAGRSLPFFYFQLLDYENVRRPDVLYGYPNVLISYAVPTLNNPAWLAEGTAQYQRAWLDYDQWDTHRDMLLRTRVLADREFSLADMGGFYSHNGQERESVYNHGYAFTRYLANTYGEEALRDVTAQLGRWGNWNVERAIEDAVGTPGRDVYAAWMQALKEGYGAETAALRSRLVEGRLLEADGYNNGYPRFSPDGGRLAYVSNRGEDYSQTSLYIRDLETGAFVSHRIDGLLDGALLDHTCALGHRIRVGVGGAFDWRDETLLYAKKKDTPEGYFYADLYEYDLTTKKEKRLTHNRRAVSPRSSPDGRTIVYVTQKDGTSNLYALDRETGEERAVTVYEDGSQVTHPVWHPSGAWIYFAYQYDHGRDLYRIRPDGRDLEPVLATPADERDPAFGPDGDALYFTSDRTGIFNLYRMPAEGGGAPEQLTNELGGAFMPDVRADGAVAYASYRWDGYKISLLDAPVSLDLSPVVAAYAPPGVVVRKEREPVLATAEARRLHAYEDASLRPLPLDSLPNRVTTLQIGRPEAEGTNGSAEAPAFKPYRNLFTTFSFYPVLRIDQYVSRRTDDLDVRLADRTRAETLLRNTKVGVLLSSREILEGLTLFGGLLVGPASRDAESLGSFFSPDRLVKLERDLFFQIDYTKGFGLIPKRWSPQVAIEFYNIRRNVSNGLSLEEFPCTACLPDTTLADLSYNLAELDVILRSKVSRRVLLETGLRLSPYSVTTERFFSKEADQVIDASTSRYFIGRAQYLKARYELLRPYKDSDVLPVGLQVEATYEYEIGRLLDRFDLEEGLLKPIYERTRNHRLTLDGRFGMPFGDLFGGTHGMGFRLRGSTIFGGEVDDFYNDYVGGLIGARGYSFYALGGNETLWFQAGYHFPLVPKIGKQVLFTYLDKLYGRIYADAAAAWSSGGIPWSEFRKDVGAELRLGLGSFYLLPTAVFVSATYGLDAFDFRLDDGFLTPDGSDTVRYGQELQWHFGVLFGFDL